MEIRKSKKTGRLIIDGKGSTILLNAGESLDIKNLKNFKVTNLKIRRKQSPLLNISNSNYGEITFCDFKDSEY